MSSIIIKMITKYHSKYCTIYVVVIKMVEMIADKIKMLRNKRGITQAELAKQLGVTRAGVNAWEMGISVPSTQYIVELALFFKVSSDYLLDLPTTSTVSVQGLSDREIASVVEIIECYKIKEDF